MPCFPVVLALLLRNPDGSAVQPAVLHAAQGPVSAWALAFVVAGAVGLMVLGVLLVGWYLARRRQVFQAEAAAVAREAEGDRTPPAEVPAWGALWVRQEDGPVEVFELREDMVTIGRSPESGLRLEDEDLAQDQAELRREGEAAVLYDLGSTKGTWVNQTRIAAPRRLSPGDVIHLGKAELVYRSPGRVGGPGGRLAVVEGQSEPAVVDLASRRELFIGRSESCDVVVQGDPHVSRRHAQLVRTAGGQQEIVDLQSTRGVLVNGRPVARAHLRAGDRIRIGATEFIYEKGGKT
jgi:pSer/pThr/pTyr-binding forkhead associated (FHA) protein